MATILLEYWYIQGGPDEGDLIRILFNDAGAGSIVYEGPNELSNPWMYEGREQYPDLEYPNSPFYLASGLKARVYQEYDAPYAKILTEPIACDIAIGNIETINPTATNNGQIIINASGTNGSKQYSINGGVTFQTSNKFTGLTSGLYEVVVYDSGGYCTAETEVTLVDETPVVDDLKINNVTTTHESGTDLNDGVINVFASGSNNPFTYILRLTNNVTPIKTQSTSVFTNVAPGAYDVLVTDSTGVSRSRKNVIINSFSGAPPEIQPQRLTVIKRVEIRKNCYRKPFFVQFLNRLGGYTHWLFEKKQVHELSASLISEYVKPYQYLQDNRGIDFHNFYQGTVIVTVGARVNTDRAIALSEIVTSKEIYYYPPDWKDGGQRVRLLPVPSAIPIYDSEFTYQDVEFQLQYPKLFLQ